MTAMGRNMSTTAKFKVKCSSNQKYFVQQAFGKIFPNIRDILRLFPEHGRITHGLTSE